MNRNVNHALTKLWQFDNALTDRWLSTRLMTRWLDGKGGYDILSYKVLKSSSYISWLKFDRRRDAIVNDLKERAIQHAELQKEGQYTFTSFSQRDVRQGASALSDFGTSIGSYKLLAKGESYINKKASGDYTITLTVYFTLADKYQWKEGKGIALAEFVDHDKMLEVEKVGAKPFWIRIYFEATYQLENGRFNRKGDYKDSVKDWYDPTANLSNPEPREGNSYAIPENEQKKVYDHRGEN
jgi:hypothetical protein